jgi:DNA-binding FrmR family transcriptional regulator
MPSDDTAILQNLRRIEGQVKGVQKMVTEHRECDEILTQIMAAKSALDRVTRDLVEQHMASCFEEMSPDEIKARMTRTIGLLCRM